MSKEEGIAFARQYGSLFLECSAKTRLNVQQCFAELIHKVSWRHADWVSLSLTTSRKASSCSLKLHVFPPWWPVSFMKGSA